MTSWLSASATAISDAVASFQKLPPNQKAWFVVAVLVFLVVAPRAAILVLVAAERLLVGSLLATEALLASLLLRVGLLAGILSILVIVLWGFYAFVIDRKRVDP